jgi:subtilisin family serine protease
MRWYFEPRREQRPDDDEEASLGLASFPAALLQRHGAAVLDPPQAAVVYGWPAPQSTVYRTRSLLVPPELLQEEQVHRAIRNALSEIGLDLAEPERQRTDDLPPRLPVTVVLVPLAPGGQMTARPVVIDAWTALQTLRAAASSGQYPGLTIDKVARIGLEHLLIGSAITGSPATEGGGLSGNPATEGGGITGPASTDSYLFAGCDARTPVELFMDAPPRQSQARCAERAGRRPVIAVLDTGVREHWWLDVHKDPAAPGGYRTVVPDGFVAVDLTMQDLIYANGQLAVTAGDQPRQLIRFPWDQPVTANPLIGELDTDTGHGTFIAGIIRQSVPDAQVLAVRIMHSDGIVYEGDLLYALGLIANRVAAAQSGDISLMVDLVSLSLGYFSETGADLAYSFALWQAIEQLLEMGIAVIAAAGNFSTRRRFYPAAFADLPAPGGVPVIAVGALNPNGSKALFSDDGRWVRAWASGAAVVSTFPTDVDGSRDPEVSMPAVVPSGVPVPGERGALDPDDYSGGFAVWSGTSFAGPAIAGTVAADLLAGAESGGGLSLGNSGKDAATSRITHALESLGWAG